jgi:hypothetical protein
VARVSLLLLENPSLVANYARGLDDASHQA